MIYLKKYFNFPGPKELGMSDNDYAMASELFRNNSTEYTWEQYYDRLKKDYPVKYFFACTTPTFFRNAWLSFTRKPKDLLYWFKCNFLPQHKYHLIDIREEKSESIPMPYRYGWIDSDMKMVMAMFKILCDFVENEMPHGYFVPSEEDAAKDDGVDCQYAGYKVQLERHKEYMAIYRYWTVDRFVLDEEYGVALTAWSNSRHASKGDPNPETEALHNTMRALEEKKDKKLEEMLHRLIDVRHCLWT